MTTKTSSKSPQLMQENEEKTSLERLFYPETHTERAVAFYEHNSTDRKKNTPNGSIHYDESNIYYLLGEEPPPYSTSTKGSHSTTLIEAQPQEGSPPLNRAKHIPIPTTPKPQEECSELPDEIIRAFASEFLRKFRPWRNQYKLLTNTEWITISNRLYTSSICKAIRGQLTIAFFGTYTTSCLGIDIDDHSPGLPSELTERCRAQYWVVLKRFKQYPSLTIRSPRGVHLFYLLRNPLHFNKLHYLAKEALADLEVEILPTPTGTIRIPSITKMLTPDTLKPIPEATILETGWQALPLHEPEDLFGTDYEAMFHASVTASLSQTPKATPSKKAVVESMRTINLQILKDSLTPFRNGQTYQPVFEFTVACKRMELSKDEIIQHLWDIINNSPQYTGDLRFKDKVLKDRVHHILGKESTTMIPFIDNTNTVLEIHKDHINYLVLNHPFKEIGPTAVKRFIERLIIWRLWHDHIRENNATIIFFDSLYPFYNKNTTEGFFPIPATMLKKWHPKYYKLTTWLIEQRVLTESPYRYSARAHICKYYAISFKHLKP